jgi:hypothetical protein
MLLLEQTDKEVCKFTVAVTLHNSDIHGYYSVNLVLDNSITVMGNIAFICFSLPSCTVALVLLFLGKDLPYIACPFSSSSSSSSFILFFIFLIFNFLIFFFKFFKSSLLSI